LPWSINQTQIPHHLVSAYPVTDIIGIAANFACMHSVVMVTKY